MNATASLILALALSIAGNCVLGLGWWKNSAARRGEAAVAQLVNGGNRVTIKAQRNALDACLFDKARVEADEQAVGEERDAVLAQLKTARAQRESKIRKAYDDDPTCAAWAAAPVCPAAAGL